MRVTRALDILMPALPRILPVGNFQIPIWIRYTKIILVEEGHSASHMVHIFQLIVRHSALFYKYRGQFVAQMINALSRFGFPCGATAENRRLAIELAGLVVSWERQRQKDNIPEDVNTPRQNGYGYDQVSGDLDPKQSLNGSAFPEDPPNRLMAEPRLQSLSSMSPGGSSLISNTDNPQSGVQTYEEFKPSAAMEEMIINFLVAVRGDIH